MRPAGKSLPDKHLIAVGVPFQSEKNILFIAIISVDLDQSRMREACEPSCQHIRVKSQLSPCG